MAADNLSRSHNVTESTCGIGDDQQDDATISAVAGASANDEKSGGGKRGVSSDVDNLIAVNGPPCEGLNVETTEAHSHDDEELRDEPNRPAETSTDNDLLKRVELERQEALKVAMQRWESFFHDNNDDDEDAVSDEERTEADRAEGDGANWSGLDRREHADNEADEAPIEVAGNRINSPPLLLPSSTSKSTRDITAESLSDTASLVRARLSEEERYFLGVLSCLLLQWRDQKDDKAFNVVLSKKLMAALSFSEVNMEALLLLENRDREQLRDVIRQSQQTIWEESSRLTCIQAVLLVSLAHGSYDARCRVLVHQLAFVLDLPCTQVAALELGIATHIYQLMDELSRGPKENNLALIEAAEQSQLEGDYQRRRKKKRRINRAVKVSGIAITGGVLFGVTGGLIAPALLGALAGLGIAGAASLAATGSLASGAAVGGVLGAFGSSFAGNKARRRTMMHLSEFDFERQGDARIAIAMAKRAAKREAKARRRKQQQTDEAFQHLTVHEEKEGGADLMMEPSTSDGPDLMGAGKPHQSAHGVDDAVRAETEDRYREAADSDNNAIDLDESLLESNAEKAAASSSGPATTTSSAKPKKKSWFGRSKKKKSRRGKKGDVDRDTEDISSDDEEDGRTAILEAELTAANEATQRAMSEETEIASVALHTCVCVPGWLRSRYFGSALEQFQKCLELTVPCSEHVALRWETRRLVQMSNAFLKFWASKATVSAVQQVYPHVLAAASTVAGAVAFAIAFPLTLMSCMDFIDNPWSVLVTRANAAGEELADVLVAREYGQRPVTLVGYSLGARVVFKALQSLARRGAKGIVDSAFLIGAPVSGESERWESLKQIVSGRLVNAYCPSDWHLAFFHRGTHADVKLAGLRRVSSELVENVNLSYLGVRSHINLQSAMVNIFLTLGVGRGVVTLPPAVVLTKKQMKSRREKDRSSADHVDLSDEDDLARYEDQALRDIAAKEGTSPSSPTTRVLKNDFGSDADSERLWDWNGDFAVEDDAQSVMSDAHASSPLASSSLVPRSNDNFQPAGDVYEATEQSSEGTEKRDDAAAKTQKGKPSAEKSWTSRLFSRKRSSKSTPISDTRSVESDEMSPSFSSLRLAATSNDPSAPLEELHGEENVLCSGAPSPRSAPCVATTLSPKRLALSLGVEITGRRVERILERDTVYPAGARRLFTNGTTVQRVLLLRIFEGERRHLSVSWKPYNSRDTLRGRVLGEIELHWLYAIPRGRMRIVVQFNVDDEGNLRVDVDEKRVLNVSKSLVIARDQLCSLEHRAMLEEREKAKRAKDEGDDNGKKTRKKTKKKQRANEDDDSDEEHATSGLASTSESTCTNAAAKSQTLAAPSAKVQSTSATKSDAENAREDVLLRGNVDSSTSEAQLMDLFAAATNRPTGNNEEALKAPRLEPDDVSAPDVPTTDLKRDDLVQQWLDRNQSMMAPAKALSSKVQQEHGEGDAVDSAEWSWAAPLGDTMESHGGSNDDEIIYEWTTGTEAEPSSWTEPRRPVVRFRSADKLDKDGRLTSGHNHDSMATVSPQPQRHDQLRSLGPSTEQGNMNGLQHASKPEAMTSPAVAQPQDSSDDDDDFSAFQSAP